MARVNRRASTPGAALALSIDALGGPQEVAVDLDPAKWEHRPDAGGQWVSHCIDPDRREKLSLLQIARIFRRAHGAGDHDGFAAFAKVCGYTSEPIAELSELAHLQAQASETLAAAQDAMRSLRLLADNPKLLATLKAHGVNVDALS